VQHLDTATVDVHVVETARKHDAVASPSLSLVRALSYHRRCTSSEVSPRTSKSYPATPGRLVDDRNDPSSAGGIPGSLHVGIPEEQDRRSRPVLPTTTASHKAEGMRLPYVARTENPAPGYQSLSVLEGLSLNPQTSSRLRLGGAAQLHLSTHAPWTHWPSMPHTNLPLTTRTAPSG
jgi:hypothetical protein